MKVLNIFIIPVITVVTLQSQVVEYSPLPEGNSFVIILDKSGSMSGEPIVDAKKGVLSFLKNLKNDDRVGLVSFSSEIDTDVPITTSRSDLKRGVNKMAVGGATRLYDALAVGWKLLQNESSRKIIVYLTDGKDTGSNFSSSNLKSMFQGSNIYVYGIGLGEDLDQDNLSDISRATGGSFHSIGKSNSHELGTIYADVLSSFYQSHPAQPVVRRGSLIVRSIPTDIPVTIGGTPKGRTPLKVDPIEPGDIQISLRFGQDRLWEQTVEVKQGYLTMVNAREADALKNLWIISKPHGATVFVDGEYVGLTSNEIIKTKKHKWAKKAMSSIKTLKVIGLKKGQHHIEVLGIPDFNFGPEQKMTIDYFLEGDDVLSFEIFKNVVKTGSKEQFKGNPRPSAIQLLGKPTGVRQ